MNKFGLANGLCVVDVECQSLSDSAQACLEQFFSFIAPYFKKVESSTLANLCLSFYDIECFDEQDKMRCIHSLAIRKSSASQFNLTALRGSTDDGIDLAWDEECRTAYRIDKAAKKMSLYISDLSFYHLIEFFRYYLLLEEKAKGSLVLHASAVKRVSDNAIFAICGVKGAGKTTTMLNLALSQEFEYFSGDKVLLDMDGGQLRVRGWPDFPHVGLGSFNHHPEFARKLGIALHDDQGHALNPREKKLIDPQHYYQHLGKPCETEGQLKALIIPQVSADKNSLRKMTLEDRAMFDANDFIEDPAQFYTATWHGLRPSGQVEQYDELRAKLLTALGAIAWYSLLGKENYSDTIATL